MLSVLIVESEDVVRNELVLELKKEYRVFSAKNGERAMALLRSQRPDILILSLSLHGMDGLLFLEEAGTFRPPMILCLTTVITEYIAQAAKSLGVGYILLKPCTLRAITSRIRDMAQKQSEPPAEDPEKIVAQHLIRLGFSPKWDGFRMLTVGIPLFAQDPAQRLTTELYPEIARRCNWSSDIAVERAIRVAISKAWHQGAPSAWQTLFPNTPHHPSNKDFLSRLGQII